MNSSEISTIMDVILGRKALSDHVFDLFVPVPGKWDIAAIFHEKSLSEVPEPGDN